MLLLTYLLIIRPGSLSVRYMNAVIQNCVMVYSRLLWSQFHLREFQYYFPFPSQPFNASAWSIVNSDQVAMVTALEPPGAWEHCRTVVLWVWVVVLVFCTELPPNFVIHWIAFRPHITKQRTVSHQSAKSPIGEYKLTKIASNFGRFLLFQTLLGEPLPKLVTTLSRLPRDSPLVG